VSEEHLKKYYVYSPWLRLFHWTMVLSIVVLFFTGLYIGNPFFLGSQGIEPTFAFQERLSMETIRYIHFSAAFILVAAFILRIYGFIVNRGDRLFPRFWQAQYWAGMVEMVLHYSLIKPHHRPYLRNPLARTSYAFVYVMLAVEGLTGFAMYFMINPERWGAKIFGPLNDILGGEYYVHLIHHYVAWLIIIFAIVHIYMSIRADFMEQEGEISSMFSGVKILPHEPADGIEISKCIHSGKECNYRNAFCTGCGNYKEA